MTAWWELAKCRAAWDPDRFYVVGAEQNETKKLCRGCWVRSECLADALDNRTEYGVWGGMSERERRKLLRQHPDVPDWRAVLVEAVAR